MTAFKQVLDNAISTTNGGLNNTNNPVTFSVATGEGAKFPAPGNGYYLTVWDRTQYSDPGQDPNMEKVLVTARSSDSITATRAQGGTSNVAHAGTITVALLVRDQHFTDIHSAINTLETDLDGVESDINTLETDLNAAEADIDDLETDVALLVGRGVPSGAISPYAGSSAPTGWLLCDGTAVSRTTYAALFALIGTTYGAGDGSTTFNLPNLKGKIPVGLDSSQTEFDALAETGGAKTHTLTTSEMPSHTHTQDAHTHTQNAHSHTFSHGKWNAGSTDLTTFRVDLNSGANNWNGGTGNTTATNQNTTATNQNTGGGGAHNNLQPYLVVNYIIKT